MDNIPQLPGICFDGGYSKSLLGAAAKSGHLVLTESLAARSAQDPRIVPHLLDGVSTNRLRKQALEMAVLFDEVHLFGLPGGFDLDATRQKLHGLFGLTFITGQQLGDQSTLVPNLIRRLRPRLVPLIQGKVNRNMRFMQRPELEYRTICAAYDAIEHCARYEVNMEKMRQALGDFVCNPTMLMADEQPFKSAITEMLKKIVAADKPDIKPAVIYLICLVAVITELTDTLEPVVLSHAFGSPLLTSRTDDWVNCADAAAIGETFHLCQFAMHDIVGYAPRVDDFEDVLRLRENKVIGAFRERLKEWTSGLNDPSQTLLERIRRDVLKANSELRSSRTKRMQATARRLSVVSATSCARRRLIRDVRWRGWFPFRRRRCCPNR
jgi:hypothetical protein